MLLELLHRLKNSIKFGDSVRMLESIIRKRIGHEKVLDATDEKGADIIIEMVGGEMGKRQF